MKFNFIKIILFLFTFITVLEADQLLSLTSKNTATGKHNLSLGMFDDRTGFSLLSYTYNVK